MDQNITIDDKTRIILLYVQSKDGVSEDRVRRIRRAVQLRRRGGRHRVRAGGAGRREQRAGPRLPRPAGDRTLLRPRYGGKTALFGDSGTFGAGDKWFTHQVMKNLHVVFTMNPSSDGLKDRAAATSPALFKPLRPQLVRGLVRLSFFQVGREFTVEMVLPGARLLPRGLHRGQPAAQPPRRRGERHGVRPPVALQVQCQDHSTSWRYTTRRGTGWRGRCRRAWR